MSNDWGATPEQLPKSQQTGGPAFPHSRLGSDCDGMALRDWFAGMAMQALLASLEPGKEHQAAIIPRTAYDMADAMVKARGAK